jgi:hypothetical protein
MPVRIHDKKQKELRVLWWTWSRACRRNAQYWSPPALLRKHVRAPAHSHVTQSGTWNNATVKAIAPAFRWREMLEDGTYCTIAEIAAAEKIMSLMWLASCD